MVSPATVRSPLGEFHASHKEPSVYSRPPPDVSGAGRCRDFDGYMWIFTRQARKSSHLGRRARPFAHPAHKVHNRSVMSLPRIFAFVLLGALAVAPCVGVCVG